MAEVLYSLRPGGAAAPRTPALAPYLDWPLIVAVGLLLGLGLVMVASASVALADAQGHAALLLFWRQALYAGMAVAAGAVALRVPLLWWQAASGALAVLSLLLLVLVLIPGLGKEVNGATRWLPLVLFNLQVSEAAKLGLLLYLAGFLTRRGDAVRQSLTAFAPPGLVLIAACMLLLAEPDFGTAVVLVAMGLALLFIAGAPLARFTLLALAFGAAGTALIFSSSYRLARLTAFLDPWADPFDSGFQLTQALIAIGRGGWLGVGLGNSVQKLFYLPEAHTDFLFAILAEELGLLGVAAVLGLFGFVVWRVFLIAARSMRLERRFGAYVAWGVGFWLGLQALINMGVNMGLLPTKGLTLPLISYGGSSLVVSVFALALVVRVEVENRLASTPARSKDEERGRG